MRSVDTNELSAVLHRAVKRARQEYEYGSGRAERVRLIVPSEWRSFVELVRAIGITCDVSPVELPYFDIDGQKCKFPPMTQEDQNVIIRAVEWERQEAKDRRPIDPTLPGTKGMSNADFADTMRKKRAALGERFCGHCLGKGYLTQATATRAGEKAGDRCSACSGSGTIKRLPMKSREE